MYTEDKDKPGPKEDRLKIDEDNWEDAAKKALKKERPKGGWPDKPKKGGNMEKPEHRKQRQEGAAAILNTIRKNTGALEKYVQMSWNLDLDVRYDKYMLEVTFPGEKESFEFFHDDLADYVGGPSGFTNARVMRVESWIKGHLP